MLVLSLSRRQNLLDNGRAHLRAKLMDSVASVRTGNSCDIEFSLKLYVPPPLPAVACAGVHTP